MSEVEPYTLLYDVWTVANLAAGVLGRAIAGSGLNAEEYALYSLIRAEGGLTPTELSRWTATSLTTVSALVRRLERRGHIKRLTNDSDRRSYRIHLTEEGTAALLRASELSAPLRDEVVAELAHDSGTIRESLSDLEHALREVGGFSAPESRAAPRAQGAQR